MRKETDALGEMSIDDKHYFGIQTQRAVDNFAVSGITIEHCPSFVRSIVQIKKAAAIANNSLGRLSDDLAAAIASAADDVLQGDMQGQFPVDMFHGGGGTAANMNVNEVLANRATERLTGQKGYDPVHPNTHVNMGQSTNDVIPAAMKMAVRHELAGLRESLERARACVGDKERAFGGIVKTGRTCLQDALPLTVGQYLSGWSGALERQIVQLDAVREGLLALPLPGTAIGTAFGAAPGFAEALYPHLRAVAGVPFRAEPNLFDGLQNADGWIGVSAMLKSVATVFNKISADLRLLSSGPRAGFNELNLPAVQPGSSIMPGKVNPVMPEMMLQIGFRVFGNDLAVSLAADRGELELNVWESLILGSVMESIGLLDRGIRLFTERCLSGLTVNEAACRTHAEASLALSTVLATLHDYPFASAVAHEAAERGLSISDVVVERGIMDQRQADRLLDPANLTDIRRFAELVEGEKR